MSELTLNIRGDSSDAERALDTTRTEVEDFTETVDDATEATDRLNRSAAAAQRSAKGLGTG